MWALLRAFKRHGELFVVMGDITETGLVGLDTLRYYYGDDANYDAMLDAANQDLDRRDVQALEAVPGVEIADEDVT